MTTFENRSSVAVAQRPATAPVAMETALREHATPVRARRRQRLALEAGPVECVYVVRSGLLGIEASPPGKHRQLLTLFYPGDIIRRSLMPDLPSLTLTALNVAEVWRFPARSFDVLLATSPEHAAQARARLAEQHARALLHTSIVGALNGDERFASLLVELGLRLGKDGPQGRAFELPLSRTDIADYLALNPDTLSRIATRLKARGLLQNARTGHTILPAWDALCSATPLGSALQSLHTPRA